MDRTIEFIFFFSNRRLFIRFYYLLLQLFSGSSHFLAFSVGITLHVHLTHLLLTLTFFHFSFAGVATPLQLLFWPLLYLFDTFALCSWRTVCFWFLLFELLFLWFWYLKIKLGVFFCFPFAIRCENLFVPVLNSFLKQKMLQKQLAIAYSQKKIK